MLENSGCIFIRLIFANSLSSQLFRSDFPKIIFLLNSYSYYYMQREIGRSLYSKIFHWIHCLILIRHLKKIHSVLLTQKTLLALQLFQEHRLPECHPQSHSQHCPVVHNMPYSNSQVKSLPLCHNGRYLQY